MERMEAGDAGLERSRRSGQRALMVAVSAVLALAALAPVATAGSGTFANTGSITIADNTSATPYPSAIEVSGLAGPVSDVNVTLNDFGHQFPADVDVLLSGPGGQALKLMSDVPSQFNPCAVDASAVDLTFDDDAAAGVPGTAALATGTYQPTDVVDTANGCGADGDAFPAPAPAPTATALSVFDGTGANGTWNLFVVDDDQPETGVIAGGWSLEITTLTPPSLTIDASPGVVLGGAVHATATLADAASPTGEIEFNAYGPDDADCSGEAAFTDTVTVSGNGDYGSEDFIPTEPGTYRWTAEYSGDQNNAEDATECADAGAEVIVASPLITDLRLDPKRFATCRKGTPPGPPLPEKRGACGSTIELNLNGTSLVHFRVRRLPLGGGGGTPGCPGFNRSLDAGLNSVPFTGNLRFCDKRLGPGRYQLNARPVSDTGERFDAVSARFRIVDR
jgi:hypothetical protein